MLWKKTDTSILNELIVFNGAYEKNYVKNYTTGSFQWIQKKDKDLKQFVRFINERRDMCSEEKW